MAARYNNILRRQVYNERIIKAQLSGWAEDIDHDRLGRAIKNLARASYDQGVYDTTCEMSGLNHDDFEESYPNG